jgi:hypothetical protein
MGRVYAGRSPGGRIVAVKVIREDLASDPEFRVRFGREIAAARRVNAAFTAPVLDADVEGPVPWLATAYVPGPPLADAIREHGPLPVFSVQALAAGLAEGLTAIHASGLVHRDLKPSNILLAADGPRLIDFGISQSAEASTLTHTGTALGSPGFMSPEQAEGSDVGPQSDMFSLGAVLAFAATGTGPFGEGSAAALIYRIVHGTPRLDDVPDEIRALAEKCLAKAPADRPTARELLRELENGSWTTASWLPESIAAGLTRHLPPAAPADPAGDHATMTVASPPGLPTPPGIVGRAAAAPPGRAGTGRHRRPRLVLTLSAATLLVAAAATFGGLALASGSKPTGPAAGAQPGGRTAAAVSTSPGTQPPAPSAAPSPPRELSAASPAGGWQGNYTVTSASGHTTWPAGTAVDGAWTFIPGCAVGPCPGKAYGRIGGLPFTMRLDHAGTGYTGSAVIGQGGCGLADAETDQLSLRITPSQAALVSAAWVATSWSGTLTMTTSPGACPGGTLTASFSSASPTVRFPSAAAAVTSVSPATAAPGQLVTIRGSGFGASQGLSGICFADNGVGWGLPGDAATFQVDSWSNDSITFTVPSPSGPDGAWHAWPGTTAVLAVTTSGGGISNSATLTIG